MLHLCLSEMVLLHACCAPCSGAIIETMLSEGLSPTVFYSNSNIYPVAEYERRRDECRRYCDLMSVPFVEDEYDHAGCWLSGVKGLEQEPERGGRCLKCFTLRLERAARYASEHGFKVLTTTLASSRWKNLDQVNEAGLKACEPWPGLEWWPRNWRKGGLQERRNQIIREQGFYNQNFCGCEFSMSKP